MTKFTKGEWVRDYYNVKTESGKLIADCGFSDEGCDKEEQANAHLIAAAPDMYKKLEDMSELLTMLDPHTHANIELDCVVYDIEELLKKARGE